MCHKVTNQSLSHAAKWENFVYTQIFDTNKISATVLWYTQQAWETF